MTRLVLSSLRAVGLLGAAVWAASALAPPVNGSAAPQARQGGQDHRQAEKKDDAAKPALVASFGDWNVFVGEAGKGRICYTLAQPKTREPASLKRDPGYAFISDRPTKGCATKCRSSWVSTSRRARTLPKRSSTRSRARSRSRSPTPNRRRPSPGSGRSGRRDAVRAAVQGRKPVGQERGQGKPADHRDAQRREAGRQGRFAQRPPVDRHLFADRLRPGDGPAAEGMPREVSGSERAAFRREQVVDAGVGRQPPGGAERIVDVTPRRLARVKPAAPAKAVELDPASRTAPSGGFPARASAGRIPPRRSPARSSSACG